MINREKDLVKSLDKKKYRDEFGLFVAEGEKLVFDLLDSGYKPENIYFTDNFNHTLSFDCAEKVSSTEMKQISNFKTPSTILATFYIPKDNFSIDSIENDLAIFLDEIQDPGNLGTIIRLADWFGIKNIVCSKNTADAFSPKTIQATMGAISRVNVHYADLAEILISAQKRNIPIYGTFLHGDNIYSKKLKKNGIIIMGNEGKGISSELESLIDYKITIPSFSENTSESLNVAIATAIICNEFKRPLY